MVIGQHNLVAWQHSPSKQIISGTFWLNIVLSTVSDTLYQSFFVPPDVILLLLPFPSPGTAK